MNLPSLHVGFPSICWEYDLLLLVNKETALAYGQGRIKSCRKSEKRYRERVGGVKEMLYSCQRSNLLAPLNHNLVTIHRLIEIG